MATALTATVIAEAAPFGIGFADFVNRSPTPFHAVVEVTKQLVQRGYIELKESAEWPALVNGSKYFVTRNASSVVAFAVGGKYAPGNGFKIVGAHTDSPNFSLKPRSNLTTNGYSAVGVQCYGGGLWHTWFDRDLTVAGRLWVKGTGEEKRLESKLVHIKKPIMRIPNLAIHLTKPGAERDSFSPNRESHLIPFIATEIVAALGVTPTDDKTKPQQNPHLFKMLAEASGVDASSIVDFDLSIVDTQPAAVGGAFDEFVFAPRIDNLLSCYCGLEALVNADASLVNDDHVRMIAFFDHEEVGSESTCGAAGSLLPDIVAHLQSDAATRHRCVANSFLLSVDGGHGCHGNYADRHDAVHRPILQGGPMIKYNANQRYSTSGETAAVIASVAELVQVPLQKMCVKNDSPCGTTIGPVLSALSGIRAVDIGAPMLSMHSIREMCGVVDVMYLTRLIQGFFERLKDV